MTLPTNPLVDGWYADPEARFYQGQAWIYATRSFSRFEDQLNLDAFSSTDLVHWTKHEAIVDMAGFPWVWQAVWAPTIAEHRGRYYLVFASNDIQKDGEVGGLEIAVADSPEGPFRAFLARPLVGQFVSGAQPIDAHFFTDEDGTVWLYWGGWRHCCVAKMNETMSGFVPFDDGTWSREITPPDYVEAPCLLKRGGVYYFMWSSGNWTDSSYRVLYATGPSPDGPFTPGGTILAAQPPLAEGPGHHGWLQVPGTDQWLIVYHRRPVGDPDRGHRYLCIDKLEFGSEGQLLPVVMTG